jgi:hypothetical protein
MSVVSFMLSAGDMPPCMHWIGSLLVVKVGLEMVAKRNFLPGIEASHCKSQFDYSLVTG